jgi:RHS repeat-associated protein
MAWTYDLDGLPHTMTYPDGSTLTYHHDDAGRVSTLEHPATGPISITRDPDGRPVHTEARGWWLTRSYTHGRLTGHQSEHHLTRLTRDTTGRIHTAIHTSPTRSSATHHYTYDPAGQLTTATSSGGGGGESAGRRSYTYDPNGRLTSETGPEGRERHFSYDDAGQLITAGSPTTGRDDVYTYDPNGRRITHNGERRYHYDPLDRLTRVDQTPLLVDALGELVRAGEVDLSWDSTDPYSPPTALGGHTLIGDHTPLAVSSGASHRWLDPDWQAGIGVSPTDDPWGGAGDGVQLGYRGELAVDGLVWLRHRAYDPATRAFLTPDPLPAVAATACAGNPYHYAGNDPVNQQDPLGLRPVTDTDLAAQKHDGGFLGGFGEWWDDNWEYVAAGAMIVGGVGLTLTGVGGAAGIAAFAAANGLLVAGADTALQKYNTGHVDWNEVSTQGLIGTAAGGATGLAAAGAAKAAEAAVSISNLLPKVDNAFQFPGAGRSGAGVKNLVGPPNTIARGMSPGRVYVTDEQGRVVLDITRDRVKPVVPGQGFVSGDGRKLPPTSKHLGWIDELWGG